MYNLVFKNIPIFVTIILSCSWILSGCLPKKTKFEAPKFSTPNDPEINITNDDYLKIIPKIKLDDSVWSDEVKGRAKICVESLCLLPRTTYFEIEGRGYILNQDEVNNLDMAKQKFENEVWPLMFQYIDKSFKKSKKDKNELLNFYEALPDNSEIKVTKFTKNFIKFTYSQSILHQFKNSDFDNESLNSKREFRLKESVLSGFPKGQIEEVHAALKVFNKIYFSIRNQNAIAIEKYGLRTFLLHSYYTTDLFTAKIAFKIDLKNLLIQVEQHFPILATKIKKNIGYNKFIDDRDLLPIEELEIAQIYKNLSFLTSLINDPWPELELLNINIEQLIHRTSVIETINNMLELRNEKSFNASKEKTYNICRESIAAHLVNKPSEVALNDFVSQINRVKDEAIQQGKILFPEKESNIIELINNVEFSLPHNENLELEQIRESVQFYIDQNDISNVMSDMTIEEVHNVSGLIVGLNKNDSVKSEDLFTDLSDLCLSYLPKGLEDHTYTLENKIVLSPNTVKNPMQGMGVVAHELAHRLQSEFGDGANKELNQCLIDRHFYSGEDENKLSQINLKKYFSEDFADNFSSKVMTALGLNNKENNLACLLFGNSNESTGRIEYFENTIHPLVNQISYNNHPSNLYRLLQIANDLNHTTQVCKDFYDEEKKNLYFIGSDQLEVKLPRVNTCR